MCLLLISLSSFAQEDIVPMKLFNGHQYVLVDTVWNEFYNGKLFPIIGDLISVKYNEEASNEAIEEFESAHNLQFRVKIGDYRKYYIEKTPDIFAQTTPILQSGLVDGMHLYTEVFFAGVSDPTAGGCSQWYTQEMEDAHAMTSGNPSVTVAVIDVGIAIDHVDLAGSTTNPLLGTVSNIYTNPGESGSGKETNGVDDDNNGHIDDVHGWNFFASVSGGVNGNGNVLPNPNFQFFHGTAVASVIAAKNWNGTGIFGVAGGGHPGTSNEAGVKILPIKIGDQTAASPRVVEAKGEFIDEAIDYAIKMGVDIINMSFITDMPEGPITYEIEEARKKNIIVVAGAGNDADKPNNVKKPVGFPAKDPYTIGVGSFTQNWQVPPVLSDWSHTGPDLDLVALGKNVCVLLAPVNAGSMGMSDGTSFSAAFVSGTAALMRSANPCIGGTHIQEILKLTAYRDGYFIYPTLINYNANRHSEEFGYGRLRTDYAVMAAHYLQQERGSRTKELYIKDNDEDIGLIDDAHISEIWGYAVHPKYVYDYSADNSPDIWVRNTDDDGTTHQSPDANVTTNVVYVRVRNIGCVPAVYDAVRLYWSNAASWTSWPDNWNGTYPTKGNLIGFKSISYNTGPLMPGTERIYKFPWNVNTAYDQGKNACLMARVESVDDPIDASQTMTNGDMVNKNNNIAMRNLQIVKSKKTVLVGNVAYPPGGFMNLVNPLDEATSYNFTFKNTDLAEDHNLNHEAEVSVQFAEADWDFIKATGQLDQEGIEINDDTRTILLREASITLSDIVVPANTDIPIYLGFSFLMDSLTEYKEYQYSVSQSFTSDPDRRLGSNNYIVIKEDRDSFYANAGPDKVINPGQSTTLVAEQLAEIATYKWYDMNDSLIYTGSNLTVSPEISSAYKLEVIASTDCFKDYDEAAVFIRRGSITNLYPNPTSSTATITYELENVTSAYIMLVQPYTTTSSNFILNVTNTSQAVDLTEYATGVYNMILVCDGIVSDVKSIQKQ